MQRLDVGHFSYRGEDTSPNCTTECREADCSQHYVVRMDGIWTRAFHNETDARDFTEACVALVSWTHDNEPRGGW